VKVTCPRCGRRVGLVTFGATTAAVDLRAIDTPAGPAFALHDCPEGREGRAPDPAPIRHARPPEAPPDATATRGAPPDARAPVRPPASCRPPAAPGRAGVLPAEDARPDRRARPPRPGNRPR
jgi:hypothetical protein